MSDSDAEPTGVAGHVAEAAQKAEEAAPSARAGSSAKARARGRGRVVRPRIDLDEQISQANKLAEVSKKMLSAARTAQKNQKKQKQRLIRKAGKLSAQDLERIAVLKRCGLYAGEEDGDTEAGSGQQAEVDPNEAPVQGPVEKKKKLSDVVQKIAGADVVLEALGAGSSSSTPAAGTASGHGSSSAVASSGRQDGRPRASRLVRALSKTTVKPAEDAQEEGRA